MKNRMPFYDTTESQKLFGKGQTIGVRVPCKDDWPLARWVPRARIKEAESILAEQKAGRLTDAEALAAIEALER